VRCRGRDVKAVSRGVQEAQRLGGWAAGRRGGGAAGRRGGGAAGRRGGGAAGRGGGGGRRHTLNEADANDAAVVSRERALTLPVAPL
jgi:hypothetical protein